MAGAAGGRALPSAARRIAWAEGTGLPDDRDGEAVERRVAGHERKVVQRVSAALIEIYRRGAQQNETNVLLLSRKSTSFWPTLLPVAANAVAVP